MKCAKKGQTGDKNAYFRQNEGIPYSSQALLLSAETQSFTGFFSGALDGGRTHNLSLRRAALYPVELRVQTVVEG
jgi:hypothetical protein